MSKKKVRLLCDSHFGMAGSVVLLDADELKIAKDAGVADDDKAAVKYAESLAAPVAEDKPLE